ncbi:chemotaxis protein CheY [Candidatus Magnetomorum sp. HK-1]|nr:chemotaxis protein CheY [Candidatus Magnetomorum sp. HK-1]
MQNTNISRSANILIVEDNAYDIELILEAFEQSKLKNPLYIARSGEEVLEYLLCKGKFSDKIKYPEPDLILLDIKLPGISGHDVLKKIKNTDIVRRIPVIMLTSSAQDGDRTLAYDYGVNSYIVKPLTFESFLNVCQTLKEYWISINIGAPNINKQKIPI